MRRDGDQTFDAGGRRQGRYRCPKRGGLFSQTIRVRSGSEPDDLELVGMGADDVERALPDRSGRPENSELFQKLYLTKT